MSDAVALQHCVVIDDDAAADYIISVKKSMMAIVTRVGDTRLVASLKDQAARSYPMLRFQLRKQQRAQSGGGGEGGAQAGVDIFFEAPASHIPLPISQGGGKEEKQKVSLSTFRNVAMFADLAIRYTLAQYQQQQQQQQMSEVDTSSVDGLSLLCRRLTTTESCYLQFKNGRAYLTSPDASSSSTSTSSTRLLVPEDMTNIYFDWICVLQEEPQEDVAVAADGSSGSRRMIKRRCQISDLHELFRRLVADVRDLPYTSLVIMQACLVKVYFFAEYQGHADMLSELGAKYPGVADIYTMLSAAGALIITTRPDGVDKARKVFDILEMADGNAEFRRDIVDILLQQQERCARSSLLLF
jgi:hypothetical protein